MNKEVIASASHYTKKYYINEKFEELPTLVKEDIKKICTSYAEKYSCILMIGYYENGEIYFETQVSEENEFAFMEIDAKLDIKNIEKDYAELLEGIEKWIVLKQLKVES